MRGEKGEERNGKGRWERSGWEERKENGRKEGRAGEGVRPLPQEEQEKWGRMML